MSVVRKYFDLNDRARKAQKNNDTVVLQGIPEVFSSETGCHLEWNSPAVQETEDPGHMSLTRQLFMYFGVFIGVLFSTAVSQFRSGESITLAITLGEAVAAAVVALIFMPHVYEKLRLYPKAPLIVQFGLFVQHGVFWHVLIELVSEGGPLMCLMVRTLYKFNTVDAFERAVQTVELQWNTKFIRGTVIYNNSKATLRWKNLREQLEKAKSANPEAIHGLIAVENQ